MRLTIQIMTQRPLSSLEDGVAILGLWKTHLDEYFPEKWGHTEPVRNALSSNFSKEISDLWRPPSVILTRKKPKVDGFVAFSFPETKEVHLHNTLIIRIEIGAYEKEMEHTFPSFLRAAAKELDADFGYAHIVLDEDKRRGRLTNTVYPARVGSDDFRMSLATQFLQNYIPDLYWCTVFGKPFVELIGKGRLANLALHRTDWLKEEIVLLQLTPFRTLMYDQDEFERARASVKMAIDNDVFFDPDRDSDRAYKQVKFPWPPIEDLISYVERRKKNPEMID